MLLEFGYERDGGGRRRRVQSGDRGSARGDRWTTSRPCRSVSRSAARWSATTVVEEHGPPHDRTFVIVAQIEGVEVGRESGRSKKDAEQEAAQAALEALDAP